MKKIILASSLILSFSFIGCAVPLVKTDLKSSLEKPQAYKGITVIFTTDLKSLLADPGSYQGKKVELSGYVKFYGHWGFWTWNFLLKETPPACPAGLKVRCYEREYRIDSWVVPGAMLRRAESHKEKIKVVGKFQNGEIELDWIEYRGQRIDTDYKPPYVRAPRTVW